MTRCFLEAGVPEQVCLGSWLCENARQRGLMGRDFSEVAAISHLAEFRAFSFGKGLLMWMPVRPSRFVLVSKA
jgi:hypothetical protein